MLDTPAEIHNTLIFKCEMGDVKGILHTLRYVNPSQDTFESMLLCGVVKDNIEIVKISINRGAQNLGEALRMAMRRNYDGISSYIEMELYHRR